MNELCWLIATAPGLEREAYRVHERDVEGYVNRLRDRGFARFFVATESYVIDNEGKKERD